MLYKKKIFIIAGEISGDQIGASILQSLKKNNNFVVYGVGGPRLIEAGLKSIFDIEKISLMGLLEVVPKIIEILRLINFTVNKIIEIKPDIIITIDAPGFNFRVLKKLKKKSFNFPNIHIVAPTVWAWKPERAKKISYFIDNLFVLFPFEKKYFTPYGINTFFIGHPLIEQTRSKKNNTRKEYISIFPGSRKNEILTHLEQILIAFTSLKIQYKLAIVAVEKHFNLIKSIADKFKKNLFITLVVDVKKVSIFKSSFAAIAVSGTITLELALHKVPFFTVYKLNYLSYLILKSMVFSKYITLVNIIFNKKVVEELIQSDFNIINIKKNLHLLIDNKSTYINQITYFNKLDKVLKNKEKAPSKYAAILLEKIIFKKKN